MTNLKEKAMKRQVCLLLLTTMLTATACGRTAPVKDVTTSADSVEESTMNVIVDLKGEEVEVPKDPKRIAAMTGPAYEMVFMLDEADRINMVKSGHTTNYPLALLTNPALENLNTVAANPSTSVNVEDYLKQEIDLVLYYENDTELKKFRSVGIPAVAISTSSGIVDSMEAVQNQTVDEYIATATTTVNMIAKAIGTEKAKAELDAWNAYTEDVIKMVYERTKDLTDEERPMVYWGNTWGENILASYKLDTRWYEVNLAGGRLVGPTDDGGQFPEVTKEQLFEWNPDIILVDNHGNYPELVIESMYKEGSDWASLQAVKNQRLTRIPAGVFFLDKGSTTALITLWMATVIQPELFADIDIVEEVQNYYINFYEYDMTREEAEKVVNGWYDHSEFE